MKKNKKLVIILILILIFILSLYGALFCGYKDFGTHLFVKLFNLSTDPDSIILEFLRVPRVIKGIIAGSCLALSGMFLQAVSKNPLAEPYITGISSGAGLGMVFSILCLNSVNYSFFGFLGALITSLLVIIFSGFSRFSITKLILIGLSMNIFVSSIITLLILTNADKAYVLTLILSGGFSSSEIISNKTLILLFVIALILSALLIPKLNLLRLDKELISLSNKKMKLYTILIIITASYVASLSVFAAGILGFIGIIVPQISKILIGQDFRWIFFANILLGSSFLLVADLISRIIIYPLQMPLGLMVSLIGAPIFVYFLTKKGDIFND